MTPITEQLADALRTARAFYAKDGSPSGLRQIDEALAAYDAAQALDTEHAQATRARKLLAAKDRRLAKDSQP